MFSSTFGTSSSEHKLQARCDGILVAPLPKHAERAIERAEGGGRFAFCATQAREKQRTRSSVTGFEFPPPYRLGYFRNEQVPASETAFIANASSSCSHKSRHAPRIREGFPPRDVRSITGNTSRHSRAFYRSNASGRVRFLRGLCVLKTRRTAYDRGNTRPCILSIQRSPLDCGHFSLENLSPSRSRRSRQAALSPGPPSRRSRRAKKRRWRIWRYPPMSEHGRSIPNGFPQRPIPARFMALPATPQRRMSSASI